MPRLRAISAVLSGLASSTRMSLSAAPGGISATVRSSVRSALYAGIVTTTFRTPSIVSAPAGGEHGVARAVSELPLSVQEHVLAQAEDAEEEGAEDHLHAERDERQAEKALVLVPERPEAAAGPPGEDPEENPEPPEEEEGPGEQAVLEPDPKPEALEDRLLVAQVEHGVAPREDTELDDLHADDGQRAAADHRVDAPLAPEHRHRAGDERQEQEESGE